MQWTVEQKLFFFVGFILPSRICQIINKIPGKYFITGTSTNDVTKIMCFTPISRHPRDLCPFKYTNQKTRKNFKKHGQTRNHVFLSNYSMSCKGQNLYEKLSLLFQCVSFPLEWNVINGLSIKQVLF